MDYITTQQAAEITGYNAAYIRRAVASGAIPNAVKLGKTWLITRDDLARWVADGSKHKVGRKAK